LLAELDEIKEVIVLYPKKRGAKTSPQHTVLSNALIGFRGLLRRVAQ